MYSLDMHIYIRMWNPPQVSSEPYYVYVYEGMVRSLLHVMVDPGATYHGGATVCTVKPH